MYHKTCKAKPGQKDEHILLAGVFNVCLGPGRAGRQKNMPKYRRPEKHNKSNEEQIEIVIYLHSLNTEKHLISREYWDIDKN